jgi:TatD DNase family protein
MTGIKKTPYINIHTHLPSEEGAISIYNAGEDPEALKDHGFISIGIHPWYIRELNVVSAFDFMRKNAANEKVLFIGECGLDKLVEVPMPEQEKIFIAQIKIAEEVKKPLIIHCVKAFDELIRIKKEQKIKIPVIIHGFNNNEQIAAQLLSNGFYLSFGKALLKEDSNAQKVIQQTDSTNFFLETDDGNHSIKSIFDKASQLKNIPVDELKEQMYINFKNLENNG